MKIQQLALLVFIIVVHMNISFLMWDLYLMADRQPTVSEICREHWVFAAMAILVNLLGVIAFICHLVDWGNR